MIVHALQDVMTNKALEKMVPDMNEKSVKIRNDVIVHVSKYARRHLKSAKRCEKTLAKYEGYFKSAKRCERTLEKCKHAIEQDI